MVIRSDPFALAIRRSASLNVAGTTVDATAPAVSMPKQRETLEESHGVQPKQQIKSIGPLYLSGCSMPSQREWMVPWDSHGNQ